MNFRGGHVSKKNRALIKPKYLGMLIFAVETTHTIRCMDVSKMKE